MTLYFLIAKYCDLKNTLSYFEANNLKYLCLKMNECGLFTLIIALYKGILIK